MTDVINSTTAIIIASVSLVGFIFTLITSIKRNREIQQIKDEFDKVKETLYDYTQKYENSISASKDEIRKYIDTEISIDKIIGNLKEHSLIDYKEIENIFSKQINQNFPSILRELVRIQMELHEKHHHYNREEWARQQEVILLMQKVEKKLDDLKA
jgi:hypothetical protein